MQHTFGTTLFWRDKANDNIQDELNAIFHCAPPQVVSLHKKYAHLFSQKGSLDISAFLNQSSIKLPFSLLGLLAFHEQAARRTS